MGKVCSFINFYFDDIIYYHTQCGDPYLKHSVMIFKNRVLDVVTIYIILFFYFLIVLWNWEENVWNCGGKFTITSDFEHEVFFNYSLCQVLQVAGLAD